MKSAVTLSLVPEAKSGPFVFWDGLAHGCEQAAALGFDAVEIFPPDASAINLAELTLLLTQHKLKVAAVGTGAGWLVNKWSLIHPDNGVRAKAREFIRQIIDLGAKFGAPAIIGSMQGRWEGGVTRPQALTWLGNALGELAAHAASQSQTLLYEPLNRYETNMFNHAEEAARFLDSLRATNVRILADLFHMNIEEASIAEALRAAGQRIGHVHFADSNRRAIGFGHTTIPPIIQALRDIRYEGYLSAEILPLPDSETAARQTIQSFLKFTS